MALDPNTLRQLAPLFQAYGINPNNPLGFIAPQLQMGQMVNTLNSGMYGNINFSSVSAMSAPEFLRRHVVRPMMGLPTGTVSFGQPFATHAWGTSAGDSSRVLEYAKQGQLFKAANQGHRESIVLPLARTLGQRLGMDPNTAMDMAQSGLGLLNDLEGDPNFGPMIKPMSDMLNRAIGMGGLSEYQNSLYDTAVSQLRGKQFASKKDYTKTLQSRIKDMDYAMTSGIYNRDSRGDILYSSVRTKELGRLNSGEVRQIQSIAMKEGFFADGTNIKEADVKDKLDGLLKVINAFGDFSKNAQDALNKAVRYSGGHLFTMDEKRLTSFGATVSNTVEGLKQANLSTTGINTVMDTIARAASANAFNLAGNPIVSTGAIETGFKHIANNYIAMDNLLANSMGKGDITQMSTAERAYVITKGASNMLKGPFKQELDKMAALSKKVNDKSILTDWKKATPLERKKIIASHAFALSRLTNDDMAAYAADEASTAEDAEWFFLNAKQQHMDAIRHSATVSLARTMRVDITDLDDEQRVNSLKDSAVAKIGEYGNEMSAIRKRLQRPGLSERERYRLNHRLNIVRGKRSSLQSGIADFKRGTDGKGVYKATGNALMQYQMVGAFTDASKITMVDNIQNNIDAALASKIRGRQEINTKLAKEGTQESREKARAADRDLQKQVFEINYLDAHSKKVAINMSRDKILAATLDNLGAFKGIGDIKGLKISDKDRAIFIDALGSTNSIAGFYNKVKGIAGGKFDKESLLMMRTEALESYDKFKDGDISAISNLLLGYSEADGDDWKLKKKKAYDSLAAHGHTESEVNELVKNMRRNKAKWSRVEIGEKGYGTFADEFGGFSKSQVEAVREGSTSKELKTFVTNLSTNLTKEKDGKYRLTEAGIKAAKNFSLKDKLQYRQLAKTQKDKEKAAADRAQDIKLTVDLGLRGGAGSLFELMNKSWRINKSVGDDKNLILNVHSSNNVQQA